MKLNMNVFCVLFFVLINTIGNHGDPNHGLTNVQTEPDPILSFIVSLRNDSYGYMCTGSVISEIWVLSSIKCENVTYIVYGLREFKNNQKDQEGEYSTTCVKRVDTNSSSLFKLKEPVESNFKEVRLPKPIRCVPGTVTVLGWVLDSERNIVVLKEISGSLFDIIYGKGGEICEFGLGSAVIVVDDILYGFIKYYRKRDLVYVKKELDWINSTMTNN